MTACAGLGQCCECQCGPRAVLRMSMSAVGVQVLYLVLIQLLDTRGTQLEPPPPEAFGL